jgi:hypothetical protein
MVDHTSTSTFTNTATLTLTKTIPNTPYLTNVVVTTVNTTTITATTHTTEETTETNINIHTVNTSTVAVIRTDLRDMTAYVGTRTLNTITTRSTNISIPTTQGENVTGAINFTTMVTRLNDSRLGIQAVTVTRTFSHTRSTVEVQQDEIEHSDTTNTILTNIRTVVTPISSITPPTP